MPSFTTLSYLLATSANPSAAKRHGPTGDVFGVPKGPTETSQRRGIRAVASLGSDPPAFLLFHAAPVLAYRAFPARLSVRNRKQQAGHRMPRTTELAVSAMTLSARTYRQRTDIDVGGIARRASQSEAAAERKRHRDPRLRIRRDAYADRGPRALGVRRTRTAAATAQQKRQRPPAAPSTCPTRPREDANAQHESAPAI